MSEVDTVISEARMAIPSVNLMVCLESYTYEKTMSVIEPWIVRTVLDWAVNEFGDTEAMAAYLGGFADAIYAIRMGHLEP